MTAQFDKSISFLGLNVQFGQLAQGLQFSPLMGRAFLDSIYRVGQSQFFHFQGERQNLAVKKTFESFDFSQFLKASELAIELYEEANPLISWGGDHSLALASLRAFLKKHPQGKILWIDAHSDINPPEKSLTGNLHGMPLALAMGLSQWKNKSLSEFSGILDHRKIFFLGVRDLDPVEWEIFHGLKLKYLSTQQLSELPIRVIASRLQDFCQDFPVHISFDIDCIDPSFAPSTGVVAHNGLTPDFLCRLLSQLDFGPRLKSIDIAEVNPLIGSTHEAHRTFKAACEVIHACLGENAVSSTWNQTFEKARTQMPSDPLSGIYPH